MTEAAFALGGVLIGGLIGFVTQAWAERLKERRDARFAARMFMQQFGDLFLQVFAVEHVGEIDPLRESGALDRITRDHYETFVRSLDTEAWQQLEAAYSAIDDLRDLLEETPPGATLDVAGRERLTVAMIQFAPAAGMIAAAAEDDSVLKRIRRKLRGEPVSPKDAAAALNMGRDRLAAKPRDW